MRNSISQYRYGGMPRKSLPDYLRECPKRNGVGKMVGEIVTVVGISWLALKGAGFLFSLAFSFLWWGTLGAAIYGGWRWLKRN